MQDRWGEQVAKTQTRKPGNAIRICSWNIRQGLYAKEAEIEDFIESNSIDLLFLLETDVLNSTFHRFASYAPTLPKLRESSSKIRIILLVKPQLVEKTTILWDIMTESLPSMWCEIKTKDSSFITAGPYREWRDEKGSGSIEKQLDMMYEFTNQKMSAKNLNKPTHCTRGLQFR